MSLFTKHFQISVCIPVYGTEHYLMECLKSVAKQSLVSNKDFLEIIVVDDCSPSNTAKSIVNSFKKETKLSVSFIRHEANKGLLEARRTAIYAAKGKYIFNLDSDDTLAQDALVKLYEKAKSSNADIVHGKASVCFGQNLSTAIDSNSEDLKKVLRSVEEKVTRICDNDLENQNENNEILNGFLIKKNHIGFLWGKLFLKETYLNAFNHIPPIECTMAEDFIQYFWLCYEAKKYTSIPEVVYNYSINTGISSRSVIDNLDKWQKVCSTASVFTSIYQEVENPEVYLTDEQKDEVRKLCLNHLSNNLYQYDQAVAPELKPEAYQLLCDYWGEDFVEKVRNLSSKKESC